MGQRISSGSPRPPPIPRPSSTPRLPSGARTPEPGVLAGLPFGARPSAWRPERSRGIQEIHIGEEAGIQQWQTAIDPANATTRWSVWCAEKLRDTFAGHDVETDDRLDLTVSLRSRRAEVLHTWVAETLDGTLALAARKAVAIQTEGSRCT